MKNYELYIIRDEFDFLGVLPGMPLEAPGYLQVELTDRCNLRCINCPRSKNPSSGQTLDLGVFEKMLDEVPSASHISFVGAGETLLSSLFPAFVSACTRRNRISTCTTNGTFVGKRLSPAVQAGLNKIAISIDACDERILSSLRSGLTPAGLGEAFTAAKRIVTGTPTRLAAAITLGRQNLRDFSGLIKELVKFELDEVSVESVHHWGEDDSLNKEALFELNPDETIAAIEEGLSLAQDNGLNVRIFDYKRLRNPSLYLNNHCHWPLDGVFIASDGSITPCCINMMPEGYNRMGNIYTQSLGEVWKNKRYRELRSSFLHGTYWKMCRSCVYRFEFGRHMEGSKI